MARLLRPRGGRVLGEGPSRASARRRRGRLRGCDVGLAGADAHASGRGRRDCRAARRALVAARGERRTGTVRTGRAAGGHAAGLRSAPRVELAPSGRPSRSRGDDPSSVVSLAPVRRSLGRSALEDTVRRRREIGALVGDHGVPVRRRVVPPAMALLPAALPPRSTARLGLVVDPADFEPDGGLRRRVGRGGRRAGGRRDVRDGTPQPRDRTAGDRRDTRAGAGTRVCRRRAGAGSLVLPRTADPSSSGRVGARAARPAHLRHREEAPRPRAARDGHRRVRERAALRAAGDATRTGARED